MFAGGGKRDGLTVDRHPGILVKKMAPFAPARLLGPGRADLHLGRGDSPRPDTLMQTDHAEQALELRLLKKTYGASDARSRARGRHDRTCATGSGRSGLSGAECCLAELDAVIGKDSMYPVGNSLDQRR
jgi:hypothetical protein